MRRTPPMPALVAAAALLLSVAAAPALTRAADVTVDGSKQYQTMEGFGTCLVAWVGDMRELYRDPEFQEIYVNEIGANMLRVNMWGPVHDKPVEDPEDLRYQNFDTMANGGRAQIFVEFGQAMRKLDPDAKIIGTVWSPPAWMKMNNSITGPESPSIRASGYTRGDRTAVNRVDPKYFAHFVQWMIEYMKWHKANGVEFYAVSVGNEVQFSQSFESCVWSGEDYATVVGMLGEAMEEQGFGDVKIFGPETMTSHFYQGGTPQYFEAIMANPKAKQHFDVAATHGYEDGFEAEIRASSSARLWEFVSQWDLPLWMTEGGTGGHDWPTPLHDGIAAAIHNSLVAGHVSAFVPWQITGGGESTHNIMVMQEKTPKTYAAMHYFKFIRPGAVRIDADPAFGDVKASAYVHPTDGRLTIVLINPTDQAQPVNLAIDNVAGIDSMAVYRTKADESLAELDALDVSNGRASLEMPAESIVTLHGAVAGAGG